MLLIYSQLKARQLLGEFAGVKLVFLEARLCPVEQLDMEDEIGCRSSRTCE
jgi:hypothetical protein